MIHITMTISKILIVSVSKIAPQSVLMHLQSFPMFQSIVALSNIHE